MSGKKSMIAIALLLAISIEYYGYFYTTCPD